MIVYKFYCERCGQWWTAPDRKWDMCPMCSGSKAPMVEGTEVKEDERTV